MVAKDREDGHVCYYDSFRHSFTIPFTSHFKASHEFVQAAYFRHVIDSAVMEVKLRDNIPDMSCELTVDSKMLENVLSFLKCHLSGDKLMDQHTPLAHARCDINEDHPEDATINLSTEPDHKDVQSNSSATVKGISLSLSERWMLSTIHEEKDIAVLRFKALSDALPTSTVRHDDHDHIAVTVLHPTVCLRRCPLLQYVICNMFL